ncbi:amine oxidase [Ilyomonas limi]|uniref:Amine oxidase n=2 Tax=Ilyomonas limi TaxID=2575867 RepID=A0A4U3L5F2_9BACT|nr:amine oxidase [Ilyomonas limi]
MNDEYTLHQSPFASFWMGGYECTDKLNAFGNRVDFLTLTGHLQMLKEDYRQLDLFDIKTVREGIRWSQVEQRPYQYDWSTVGYMMECAKAQSVQQVWDICHFGFPDDLTPLHPHFARRFSALCRAFVRFYRSIDTESTLIVTPINEVSFLSWLGGDVRGTSPYCVGQGWEVKYHLMQAYIEGIAAMKEEDPDVRILTTEPLTSIVPELDADEEGIEKAAALHELQFQVTEMLCGFMCPELGGKPEYLDILGFNYYHNNQWVADTGQFLPWGNENNDPRWQPLSDLMYKAYKRYNRPFVLTETSHPGVHRPEWLTFVAASCAKLLREGLPLWGICWYPIIDRPDWDHMQPWHRSGVWDILPDDMGSLRRVLHQPTAIALRRAQEVINKAMMKKGVMKAIL